MLYLPPKVGALVNSFEAWIVGGAAVPNAKDPRDFDVVVPYWNWGQACHLIPKDAKLNSLGGWKFRDNGYDVDVWMGDVAWVMLHTKAKFALQPRHGIRLRKEYVNDEAPTSVS